MKKKPQNRNPKPHKGISKSPSIPVQKSPQSWVIILVILVFTFIVFSPSLKNEFTNWDDPVYVMENTLIRDLSAKNIKTIFDPETKVSLNYHPITILSLAMNYHYSKLKPQPYILTNILLHLVNTALVFFFIFSLTNKKLIVAGLSALWFGIHPMHVESVPWVSERKDVLYVLFFLAGLISYLKYLDRKQFLYLGLALLFFILSCLSKAMAVVFPIILYLVDYLKYRKFTFKSVGEKIPFLIISILIGMKAVSIQSQGAIAEFQVFTLAQRFMFAAYGFVTYLTKLFYPINLSAFYPYPTLDAAKDIPSVFYVAPLLALVMLLLPGFFLYKSKREYFRAWIFGMGFFFFGVALVLQFISVGAAIMADRYTYLAYIGIFFLVGLWVEHTVRLKKYKFPVIFLVAAFTVFFAYAAFQRTKVWKNSETLWSDVIEKYPLQVQTAYKNRGNFYVDHQDYDRAYENFITGASMPTKDAGIYSNLGNIYSMRKQFDKALEFYSKTLEINPKDMGAFLNRAITYSAMKQYEKALKDYAEAAKLDPNAEKIQINRSFTLLEMGKYKESAQDLDFLIGKNPENPDFYFGRGRAYFGLGDYENSRKDFEKTIQLKQDYAAAYYNLSVIYSRQKNWKNAYASAKKAKELNFPVQENFFRELEQKGK